MSKFISATLLELAKRLITFDKSLAVYANGVGNDYPERVERIINNSATGKPATTLMRKYLVGKGFGDELNATIVNKEKGTTLRRFLYDICHSYAYQNGVFIHVNYNATLTPSSVEVLPYSHCLVGKKDDKEYNGKICVYDDWSSDKVKRDDILKVDVYNTDKKVIEAQVKKAGGIENYRGQIYFYNPEMSVYPLAHMDSVLNDADSEFRASEFKNLSLRKGFFGKKVVVTPPMVDGDMRKHKADLSDGELMDLRAAETERKSFREAMESFVGASNADGMLHLEMEFDGDDIDKAIKFIDVTTNINDKLFAHTETSVSRNIAKALGVPAILIDGADNSIFGNSGALLVAAQRYYQAQRFEDVQNIETDILNKLLKDLEGFNMPEAGLKIIPLINTEDETDENGEFSN